MARFSAEKLRSARLEKGLTQPIFAAMLGIGERTLVRWESGETPFFLSVLAYLEEVTGHPASWFFEPSPPQEGTPHA